MIPSRGTNGIRPDAAPHLPSGCSLAEVQRRLHAASTIGELLARASEQARETCGFQRCVVLSIEDGQLTARHMDALADAPSDALRRRVLAEPIVLRSGTHETELIRRAEGARRPRAAASSAIRDALSLGHHLLGVVAPESRAVAMLVADRPDRPVSPRDERAAELFCHLLGLALERTLLRSRMREMGAELQYLTLSAGAFMREVIEMPIALAAERAHGHAFSEVVGAEAPTQPLQELLTEREREIAALMAAGRSNREIADRLILSPLTVKGYVTSVLRKLGAENRVQAAARFLQLTGGRLG